MRDKRDRILIDGGHGKPINYLKDFQFKIHQEWKLTKQAIVIQ